jgi:hypothetical protein
VLHVRLAELEMFHVILLFATTVGGAEPGFRVCVYLPSAKESAVMSSNPSFYFNTARQGLSDKGLTDVYGTAPSQPCAPRNNSLQHTPSS